MRNKIIRGGIIGALMVLSCTSFSQETRFGRYVGTLTHDFLEKDQLAKLDFVVSRTNENDIDLKAVLSLYFGGFDSSEYVSFHFDNVNYNLLSGVLTFDTAEEDVTIVSEQFSNGVLVANLRSASFGRVGQLRLSLGSEVQPELPILNTLNGEYRGVCEGRSKVIQIYTYRSTEDTSRIGSPFLANEIRGQYGTVGPQAICDGFQENRGCTEDFFNDGSYNFYSGDLVLNGNLNSLYCQVNGQNLVCDNDCTFEKRNVPFFQANSLIFSQSEARYFGRPGSETEPVVVGPVESLSGTYKGYLHHEFLDQYQPAEIDIVTYQEMQNGQSVLIVSAIAKIIFGDNESREFISYRFEPRPYPNPLIAPQFLLSRLEDDVDAFLKITELGNGVIKGDWNSLIFGKVGRFEMSKNDPISLPAQAQKFRSVSSQYDNEEGFDLRLRVLRGGTPPNSENPFYPLHIGGTIRYSNFGRRHPIDRSSYDFYTGRFALFYDDGRMITGHRDLDGTLTTFMTSNGFATLMPNFYNPRIFRKSNR